MIKALDVAFQQNGLTLFLLLRLSPVVPFNAINYIGGVTSMKFRHYFIALVGLVPGTVLYCFIGATAGSLTESRNAVSGPLAIVSLVVGSVLGLLAIISVSYYAKREFNRIIARSRRGKDRKVIDFPLTGSNAVSHHHKLPYQNSSDDLCIMKVNNICITDKHPSRNRVHK